MTAIRDGSWSGQPCVVLGGGPSLDRTLAERLIRAGWRSIGVNRAFRLDPEVAFSMCPGFLTRVLPGGVDHDAWKAHRVPGVYLDVSNGAATDPDPRSAFDVVLPTCGEDRWGRSLVDGLTWVGNSGLAAINLADVLGADPILLLGFDLAAGPRGEQSWHEGWEGDVRPEELYRAWRGSFARWLPHVRGTVIVGAAPPWRPACASSS